MNMDDVMTAVRRSERAWCEQICAGESLDFGVAYTSSKYPTYAACHQLRDAWIADVSPDEVFDRCEAYFSERGVTCSAWTPASSQSVEPVAALMARRGWHRLDMLALGLVGVGESSAHVAAESVRILPARAMRRAYRNLLDIESNGDEACIEAGVDRLDDANFDCVIAQIDGVAVGRIAYFEVGDIGRLADFHVLPSHRVSGAAEALIAHFLQTARRLSPRAVVACVDSGDIEDRMILERHGFAAAGELPRFVRNAD